MTLSLSHIKQVNYFHSQHLLSDQIGNYYVKLKASLTKKFYIVPDWQKWYKEKLLWFKHHGDTSPILEAIKAIIYTHSTHWVKIQTRQSQTVSLPFICATPQNSLSPFFKRRISVYANSKYDGKIQIFEVLLVRSVKFPLPVSGVLSLIAEW